MRLLAALLWLLLPLAGHSLDTRPFDHRAPTPRSARRLNHAFKYLYRHGWNSSITEDPWDFLHHHAGYSPAEIEAMNATFPPLLTLSVRNQLYPKLRFLRETLQMEPHELPSPHFFGARLEATLAPRHAYLVWRGLPHGRALLERWDDFLRQGRQVKSFARYCGGVSPRHIQAFEVVFGRGLLAATRQDLLQQNHTWPMEYVGEDLSSARLMELLISHGANPKQVDHRGVSLLHWAAGTGHLDGLRVLWPYYRDDSDEPVTAVRDGATLLHWAAAGANAKEFGTGGHVDVCAYLLEKCGHDSKEFVNQRTKDGNSALMWAAWSGTLETVKLLVRNRAEPHGVNRNGCTVAHWASSGGNVEVCKYLHEVVGVDFGQSNYGGNTPLTHAVAFGRADVVQWLRSSLRTEDDDVAWNLAQDFVRWTDGDSSRRRVLQLFEEDWVADDQTIGDTRRSLG